MTFENGMTCEIMISNGTFTVGYVNGKPAEWVGNNEPLTDGGAFRLIKDEGSTIIFSKQNFRATSKYDPECSLKQWQLSPKSVPVLVPASAVTVTAR